MKEHLSIYVDNKQIAIQLLLSALMLLVLSWLSVYFTSFRMFYENIMFPIVALFVLVYAFGVHDKHIQFNMKADDDGNYFRILTSILVIVLGLTSILYSIQSEIISQHDKNDIKRDQYKWCKTHEILMFPVEEMCKMKNKNNFLFNFKDSKIKKFDLHIFIIDQTLAIKLKQFNEARFENLKTQLRGNVIPYGNSNNLDTNMKAIDIFCFDVIRSLRKFDSSNILVSFYDGFIDVNETKRICTSINSELTNNIYDKQTDISDIYNDYILALKKYNDAIKKNDSLKKIKKPKNAVVRKIMRQKTDINFVIQCIAKILTDVHARGKYDNIAIHFVSDFNDDFLSAAYPDWYYYENLKSIYTDNSIKNFSIIVFPAKKITDSSTRSKSLFISSCRKVFNNRFNFSSNSMEFPEFETKRNIDNIECEYINTNICDTAIDFYFPYSYDISDENSECNFAFSEKPENLRFKFECSNLKNGDIANLSFTDFAKNKKYMLSANDDDCFPFDKDNNTGNLDLNLNGNCNLNDKKLFLDIVDKMYNKRYRIRLNTIPLLPVTSCIYFTILYDCIVLAFSLILILSSIVHLYSPKISIKEEPDNTKISDFHKYVRKGTPNLLEIAIYYSIIVAVMLFNICYLFDVYRTACQDYLSTAYSIYGIICIILILAVRNYFLQARCDHRTKLDTQIAEKFSETFIANAHQPTKEGIEKASLPENEVGNQNKKIN